MRDRLNLRAAWVLAVCLSALSCVISVAHAGDVKLTYIPPSTCADGASPVTMCPTTGYEVSEGTSLSDTFTVKETVGPTVVSRTYTGLTPGTRCYSVKTVSGTLKSDESTRACVDVPSLPPKAPSGITVTVQVTVSAP